MNVLELYNAPAVAAHWTNAASNAIPYLGEGLFPAKKKRGLDLKSIYGYNGLPISLAPSNFDAKSTLRSREAIKIGEMEMAFFRESMLLKEQDEQDIDRLTGSNDPYADDVVARIYNDADNLIAGANVVPERMRMQLLCPVMEGRPGIVIAAKDVQYLYDYDPDGAYAKNNYKELMGASGWNNPESSDPFTDIREAQDAVEEQTGSRPSRAIMNRNTFTLLLKNHTVQSAILAQNVSANVVMNEARVKEVFKSQLGIDIIVYNKQYRDEDGRVHKFFEDGYVTLIPEGTLGSTWYSYTPEERTLAGSGEAKVSVVNTGVAVVVTITSDPVNTKTTVSEIVLPSFERMQETFAMKVISADEN